MDLETNNQFLNSLRHIEDTQNLHMNIFTKAITKKPSLFTTSDLIRIGKACENALETLNQWERPNREQFIQENSQKIGEIKQQISHQIEKNATKIKNNPILKLMGVAKQLSTAYKRWKSPQIVLPDLEVTLLQSKSKPSKRI